MYSTEGFHPSINSARTALRQVQQALKSFGRRYLCQLQVLPGRALLLSLGEEGVNAHRLPHFKVTAQATRTRSALPVVSRVMSCSAKVRQPLSRTPSSEVSLPKA